MINPEIRERMAFAADDGTDMKLVEVTGTHHAGAETARRHVVREGVRASDILAVEYAGRGDHGDPVYLVTWQTAWSG